MTAVYLSAEQRRGLLPASGVFYQSVPAPEFSPGERAFKPARTVIS